MSPSHPCLPLAEGNTNIDSCFPLLYTLFCTLVDFFLFTLNIFLEVFPYQYKESFLIPLFLLLFLVARTGIIPLFFTKIF